MLTTNRHFSKCDLHLDHRVPLLPIVEIDYTRCIAQNLNMKVYERLFLFSGTYRDNIFENS